MNIKTNPNPIEISENVFFVTLVLSSNKLTENELMIRRIFAMSTLYCGTIVLGNKYTIHAREKKVRKKEKLPANLIVGC